MTWQLAPCRIDPDLVVTQDGESRWSVLISQPADAAVTVDLSVVSP